MFGDAGEVHCNHQGKDSSIMYFVLIGGGGVGTGGLFNIYSLYVINIIILCYYRDLNFFFFFSVSIPTFNP